MKDVIFSKTKNFKWKMNTIISIDFIWSFSFSKIRASISIERLIKSSKCDWHNSKKWLEMNSISVLNSLSKNRKNRFCLMCEKTLSTVISADLNVLSIEYDSKPSVSMISEKKKSTSSSWIFISVKLMSWRNREKSPECCVLIENLLNVGSFIWISKWILYSKTDYITL